MFSFKFKSRPISLLVFILPVVLLFTACTEDDGMNPEPPPSTTQATGWNENDDPSTIPSDLNLGDNTNIPSSYSLLDRFPPTGDQGNYGTCVAWSTGYNLKTALNAIEKNWTRDNELKSASVQMSPKDLFLSIPNQEKGLNCDGTLFTPAFNQMAQRGVATMASAPYTGLGNCSQNTDPNLANEAAQNKIGAFRKINIDVNTIKGYIASDRPVAFGALVGDQFSSWRSDQVITSDAGNPGGHAMVVIGYDDNKGANGAFQILNSWGDIWGSNGVAWVDYNFFVSGWTSLAFVATNGTSTDFDPTDPGDVATGNFDLIPWNVSDDAADPYGDPRDRVMTYNVYNIGSQAVSASNRWNVSYVYYNAYDANDYGIVLYDEYSDAYGTYGQDGELTSGGFGLSGNWWNHIDIPSNSGAAEELFGVDYFTWTYTMPNLNGYYYLVCIADAFDQIKEADEANNYFFMTGQNGDPIYFENGVIDGALIENDPDAQSRSRSQLSDAAVAKFEPTSYKKNTNAYTKEEISKLITSKKESGELTTLIQEYQSRKTARSK